MKLQKNELTGRCIDDKHINAFTNGIYKKLFEGIKEDAELSLEIRMNNQVIVYYHKDKILTTSIDSKGTPVIKMLDSKYYKNKKKPSVDLTDIKNLLKLTRIRIYFKEAKELVYFCKKGEEFDFQQNIALGNHSFGQKYLVVDMEWQFSQSQIKKEERLSKTRIDLVIVDTIKNENGYNDIYLAELKVGTGATSGKSGIIDHLHKTSEIIQNPEACSSLIRDVTSIIDCKTKLGLLSGDPKIFSFSEKPKMMLITVYRSKNEQMELDEEMHNACTEAERNGMDKPLCFSLSALVELQTAMTCE